MFEFRDVEYKGFLHIPELKLESGKITSILGASGSGKTTILKLLNKMISPTHGVITYNGEDLSQINSVDIRRKFTMLSQNSPMFKGSIRDNLLAGLRFQERDFVEDMFLNQILKQVRLDKPLDVQVDNISGGEKQRLALGRVLLLNPEVYLLDEPSSALDEETETLIIQMLTKHVKKYNKTMIMVTHSKTVANKYSDSVVILSHGEVIKRM